MQFRLEQQARRAMQDIERFTEREQSNGTGQEGRLDVGREGAVRSMGMKSGWTDLVAARHALCTEPDLSYMQRSAFIGLRGCS